MSRLGKVAVVSGCATWEPLLVITAGVLGGIIAPIVVWCIGTEIRVRNLEKRENARPGAVESVKSAGRFSA